MSTPSRINSPLPWGEGVPLPAFSSAGVGRVRGLFARKHDYLIITPQATRGPALPAGSVLPSSGLAWITSAVPPS